MITTSQAMMTVPKDMFLYLFTIAAMMSVPPVDPLLAKQRATPVPQRMAPKTQAMKDSSPMSWGRM